ncbi:hypothetical protein G6F35_018704 [Rhizopus arrhizus]|nr:hypothetical protein G6F35_018704 [Rhizopus arrhizus]KAG1242618.1 hypothetical protein G6F65_022926 [Rhizopus arrhizus]
MGCRLCRSSLAESGARWFGMGIAVASPDIAGGQRPRGASDDGRMDLMGNCRGRPAPARVHPGSARFYATRGGRC